MEEWYIRKLSSHVEFFNHQGDMRSIERNLKFMEMDMVFKC